MFWGDMDAGEATDRANQLTTQACADRFVITYTALQDNDEETWNNTAGITLFDANGLGADHAGELSGQTIRFTP